METDKLQEIWQGISTEFPKKNKEELWVIIYRKSRQIVNKLLFISTLSGITCLCLSVYLVFTATNRLNDTLYLINNGLLLLITITLFGFYLVFINNMAKFNNSKVTLKQMLFMKIALLKRPDNKYRFIAIPVIFMLVFLSIHVYFSGKLLIDALRDIPSLVAGTVAGLGVAFWISIRLCKFQNRKMTELKKLYSQLCEMEQD